MIKIILLFLWTSTIYSLEIDAIVDYAGVIPNDVPTVTNISPANNENLETVKVSEQGPIDESLIL